MARASSTVLYVEDDENDQLLMDIAFGKTGCLGTLKCVKDGQEAIDYLAGTGIYAHRESYPVPEVVLLDLNLPEVHGFDVLKWIRANPSYEALPVVVFSSSDREEDRERARSLGANQFIPKASSLGSFGKVAQILAREWLTAHPASPFPGGNGRAPIA